MKRLAARLAASHLAVLGALTLVLLVNLSAFFAIHWRTEALETNIIPSFELATTQLVALETMEDATARYLVADPAVRAGAAEGHARAVERFDAAFVALGSNVVGPGQARRYTALVHAYGGLVEIERELRAHLAAGRLAEAQLLYQREYGAAADRVRAATTAFAELKRADATRLLETQHRRIQVTEILALAFSAAGALAGLWLWRRNTSLIVTPLRALTQAVTAHEPGTSLPPLLAEGRRTLEIAALEDAFREAAARLRQAHAELAGANAELESEVERRTAELRSANAQLAEALAASQALERQKADFQAVTNHELLTPINFITGYGSALEDGLLGPLSPEQQHAAGKIMEGAGRLTRMVRNTLEHGELLSGRLRLAPEAVSLMDIVEPLLAEARPSAEAKHLSLSVEAPVEAVRVVADPERAATAARELIDNALKFTPEGGKVRLEVRGGSRPALVVADTGPGIPEHDLERMFDPFAQLDGTTTRRHGGLGLGLSLARGLACAMGGSVEGRSRPGQGSVFTLSLPPAG